MPAFLRRPFWFLVLLKNFSKKDILFFLGSPTGTNFRILKLKLIRVNQRDYGSKYEVKSYLGISMKVMIREDMKRLIKW